MQGQRGCSIGSLKGFLKPKPGSGCGRVRAAPGFRAGALPGLGGKQRLAAACGQLRPGRAFCKQSDWNPVLGSLTSRLWPLPHNPAGGGAVTGQGLVSAKLQTDPLRRELADPMPLRLVVPRLFL